ncbi:MAG: hypothetical protein H0V47_16550 [Chloroflexia bacterium]|jgi:hypothetical protein|nr:hypothetical protein [Chloroflexia bacterium]
MRAAEMQQFPETRLRIIVVAIGVLVAVLAGWITFTLISDDATSPARPAPMVSFVDSGRFREMNTLMPEYSGNPVSSTVQNRFIEMNTQLPEYSGDPARSSVQNRFMEMNTQLPEYSGGPVHSQGHAQHYK